LSNHFAELPSSAAWQHHDARQGFESMFVRGDRAGRRLEGHTAAVEDGEPWVVRYVISLDERWITRTVEGWGWSQAGDRGVRLEADGSGRWWVDGSAAPMLDGCVDIDLESSACTNLIPVHRLSLEIGESADVPAAYVRAIDLRVERLEQRYTRIGDDEQGRHSYDYGAPELDFTARLAYDESGLVVEYPGLASRVR
jgi:hypothetical protein